ncbi:hypothetical protein [Streptomyces sp. NRRL F-5123]|uniref:hypothetical protein n=1 Tax=Streptomyces sp. NRRL F-5123 TaxID=1463856 RepID=UPI0004E25876|nr:hypothetical protein [Streptomyces sp. NRRL F-5123]
MSDLPSFHSATVDAIIDHAGRATIPFQRAHREEQHATAFWFNELVETSDEGEVVRQYLVTAGEPTRVDIAEFTLRPELCEPTMSAEKLLMADFSERWTHLDRLGVAVMSTAGLHAHGARKGWRWSTDEITDGIAAGAEDIAALGAEPAAAYLLGHDVDPGTGARELVVVVGEVTRDEDGDVRWVGNVPRGCVGAPVFTGVPKGGDRFKLVCAGVLLPGDGDHPVAPFDRLRTALRALTPEASAAPEPAGPRPRDHAPKQRWWRRRG